MKPVIAFAIASLAFSAAHAHSRFTSSEPSGPVAIESAATPLRPAETRGTLRIYRFGFPAAVPQSLTARALAVVAIACDSPVDFSRPSAGATCVVVTRYRQVTMTALILAVTTGRADEPFAELGTYSSSTSTDASLLATQARYATPAQPMEIVLDLNSQQMSYGIGGKEWTSYYWR